MELSYWVVEVVFAAVDRVNIAEYINTFIWIYTALIFIRILLSWITRIPYNRVLNALLQFVHDVTEPYLRIFRRFIPPLGGENLAIDLSPLIGLLVLQLVGRLVVSAVAG